MTVTRTTFPRSHELVLQQLHRAIAVRRLHVGDRLPAERELSEIFGVSRSAVREAMRVLESRGVLDLPPGHSPRSGVVLADRLTDALTETLRTHVSLGMKTELLEEVAHALSRLEATNSVARALVDACDRITVAEPAAG